MKPEETTELRFGSYEVLTRPDGTLWELGAGGFGRTFRARHRLLGTEVALKVIHDRHAFDARAKARFIREAQEQANLVHPGIARITYCDEIDGTLFYVMDLCEGGDLQRYVEQTGPLSVAEAFFLIEQAADAIAFAHGRGLIHRDIKPSNLLLVFSDDGTPAVKLIDFGLVKRVDGTPESTAAMLTQDGQSLFSPAFASPEQMREQKLDARSDIFSLGMTLWFLLVGGRPIEGSTAEVVSDRLSAQEYDKRLPPGLTGPPRAVLARMLRKSPGERYQNGRELLDDIRACRRSLPLPGSIDWRDRRRRQASLHDRYEAAPAGTSALGEVLRGRDRRSDANVELTVVSRELAAPQLQQLLQTARRLMEARHPGIVQVLDVAQYEEGWVIVREHPHGETLLNLLRQHGAPGLQRGLALLQELAVSMDAAEELRVPSVAAHPSEIILQPRMGSLERGMFDWQGWRPRLQPQLVAAGRPEMDPGATAVETMVAHDGDFRPAFAGLLYWVVSGRAAPHSARLDTSGYTPVPGLGEESNRILAGVLAGVEETESCEALLRMLQHLEGISEKKIEAERRRALGEMFDTLAAEARGELAALDETLAEIGQLAATLGEGQGFVQEAGGFRQQANDALLSLSRDSMPETASSTILFATLNEAEGALSIMREALAGARLLADRVRAAAAEEALSREQFAGALAQAREVVEPALQEAGDLLGRSAEAAKVCEEAAELLPSAEEWADRLKAQAAELNRLMAAEPRTVAEIDRARAEVEAVSAQAAQALDQLRTWARQILRLAERARQQEMEERRARESAAAQFGTIVLQAEKAAAEAVAHADRAQHVAESLAEVAPLAARCREAAGHCERIAATLRELSGRTLTLPLAEVQRDLARAIDLQVQLREQQSIAAQTAEECDTMRAMAEAAARREQEHNLAEAGRIAERLKRTSAQATAQVHELDQIALRHEEAGAAFLAASRAGRLSSKAAAEAVELLNQAASGMAPADSALVTRLGTLMAAVDSAAAEIRSHLEEGQRILAAAEERARAEQAQRSAAVFEIGNAVTDAAGIWESARTAVAALGDGSEVPEPLQAEYRGIQELLRDARRIVRGLEESAAGAADRPLADLPSIVQAAMDAVQETERLCGDIRRNTARLHAAIQSHFDRERQAREEEARLAAAREAQARQLAERAEAERRREMAAKEAAAREAATREQEARHREAQEREAQARAAREQEERAGREAKEQKRSARQAPGGSPPSAEARPAAGAGEGRSRRQKVAKIVPLPVEGAEATDGGRVTPPPGATRQETRAPKPAPPQTAGPGQRRFPVIPAAVGAAAVVAAGLIWFRKGGDADPGRKPDPDPVHTPAAVVSSIELRGPELPADLGAFRFEGSGVVVTAAADAGRSDRLTISVTGDRGVPLKVIPPGGFSVAGDVRSGEDAVLTVSRATGEAKAGEPGEIYTRAWLVWKEPLPGEPLAGPPAARETALQPGGSAVTLPTGVYEFHVDDDADGPVGITNINYLRRSAADIRVEAGKSVTLDFPAPYPDRLSGGFLMTVEPPADVARTVAAAGGGVPVVGGATWRLPVGAELNMLRGRPEVTFSPDPAADADYTGFLVRLARALAALHQVLPEGALGNTAFARIPAMDSWSSHDQAKEALAQLAAAFGDSAFASLPAPAADAVGPDERAAITRGWEQLENSDAPPLSFSLNQVGSDGSLHLDRYDDERKWDLTLTPQGNGTWTLSGTKTVNGPAAASTLAGELRETDR